MSSRGGRRSGAGRKKGSVAKVTELRQEMIAKAVAKGITPLEFLLNVMNSDVEDGARRLDAAKAAAPYVHPRLAAVEHSGQVETKHVSEFSDDELADIALRGSNGAAEEADGPSLAN